MSTEEQPGTAAGTTVERAVQLLSRRWQLSDDESAARLEVLADQLGVELEDLAELVVRAADPDLRSVDPPPPEQTEGEYIAQLTVAVEHRTTIGIALGIVMQRFHIGEDEAFLYLRRLSSTSNRKLYALAEEIKRSGGLPQG
jgi:hypothetical protein